MDQWNMTGNLDIKIGNFLLIDERHLILSKVVRLNGWEQAKPNIFCVFICLCCLWVIVFRTMFSFLYGSLTSARMTFNSQSGLTQINLSLSII